MAGDLDTGTLDGDVLSYRSAQGTVDYSKSPTGTYLKTPGHVMTAPVTLYFIFYGAAWKNQTTAIQFFHDFANGLSGSPLYSVLSSYDDGNGNSVPDTFTVYPTDYFDFNYSQNTDGNNILSPSDIAAEIDLAVSSGTLPRDPNGIYWVLPDLTVGATHPNGTFCSTVCGYHPKDVHPTYTLHGVFMINPKYCDSIPLHGCDFPYTTSPNGVPAHDAMVQGLWHETAEALTDPDGQGYWIDTTFPGGAKTKETGDQCEGAFVEDSSSRAPVGAAQTDLDYSAANGANANTRLGGLDYLLQPLWQDAARGGCVRRLILNRPAAAIGATGATGDLDANGVSDFLWRDDRTGALTAITLDQSDNRLASTVVTGATKPMSSQVVGFADFNGDQSADLLWQDLATGKLTVWGMGGAVVQSTATLTSVNLPSNMIVKAVGDFDGNGRADILFQDVNTMATRTWLDGSWAAFDPSTLPVNAGSPSSSDAEDAIGTGDFDHDSHNAAEVLLRDLSDGSYHIWKFTGSNFRTIQSSTISLPGIARVLGIVDIDRDGTADIVAVDSNTNPSVVWFKMTNGVPGAARTILAMPDKEWRFSGGVRSGIGGAAGLLWYDRQSGDVARWRLDASGNFATSSHLVVGEQSYMQLVSN
jgi:hypothetical protein